jgi:hypothetical protein
VTADEKSHFRSPVIAFVPEFVQTPLTLSGLALLASMFC